MYIQSISNIIDEIKEKKPIVFHITNVVTINDCANITLAIGASPLMSFCKEELREILSFSSSLVINIGTMEKSMTQMVVEAGKIANELNKPIILDPVGAGASKVRKKLIEELIKNVRFSVIKGNIAEIKAIAGIKNIINRGVDSIEEIDNADQFVKNLAQKLNCTIAMTGKKDIISDGKDVAIINNGISMLGKVTGTGCMTTSLIGSSCGVNKNYFLSSILGVSLMGISGEIAFEKNHKIGNGTLRTKILDNIYNITKESFIKKEKIQIITFS